MPNSDRLPAPCEQIGGTIARFTGERNPPPLKCPAQGTSGGEAGRGNDLGRGLMGSLSPLDKPAPG